MKNSYSVKKHNNSFLANTLGEIIENYFYHYYSIDMEEDRTAPAVIIEKDDSQEFLIRINGSAKNDRNTSVAISKDSILIKSEGRYGSKKHSAHQRDEVNFERVIPLPENTVNKKAEAFFDNGNLCVRVPKKHNEECQSLKIINDN